VSLRPILMFLAVSGLALFIALMSGMQASQWIRSGTMSADALSASVAVAGLVLTIFSRFIEACDRALAIRPNNANDLDSRCFVYFRMGQLAQARADCDAALAIEPKFASSLFMRGIIKRRQGDNAGADAAFAAAKALDPNIAAQYAKYGVTDSGVPVAGLAPAAAQALALAASPTLAEAQPALVTGSRAPAQTAMDSQAKVWRFTKPGADPRAAFEADPLQHASSAVRVLRYETCQIIDSKKAALRCRTRDSMDKDFQDAAPP
jgi:tetratricopeptide (TPR) repeat protein